MAKGSMKDISDAIDSAIDGSTPDTVMDHDDMRGDGTYGTTATPSSGSQGLQSAMIRNIISHLESGNASDDDIQTMHDLTQAGKNGVTPRSTYMPNSDDGSETSTGRVTDGSMTDTDVRKQGSSGIGRRHMNYD